MSARGFEDFFARTARWGTVILILFAALGIAWRLRNYLAAKSVWLDEVSLATEMERLSMYELLTGPLGRFQVAPPGYLFFSKIVTSLTPMNEFTLRIVPFAGSVIGVLIGFWIARRAVRLSLPARVIFLGLLAVSPVLGLYAAEAKQYGLDATITLSLLALVLTERPLIERWKTLAAGGAIALWFSHPALFTLAAVGVALLMEHESRATAKDRRRCFFVFGAWALACFVVFGPLFVEGGPSARLHSYWRAGFAPGWPASFEELRWYPRSILNFMQVAFGPARRYGIGSFDPQWTLPSGGFFALFIVGWLSLRTVWPRLALISATMLLGAIGAAILSAYPFRGRLLYIPSPDRVSLCWRVFPCVATMARYTNSPGVELDRDSARRRGGEGMVSSIPQTSGPAGHGVHWSFTEVDRSLLPSPSNWERVRILSSAGRH